MATQSKQKQRITSAEYLLLLPKDSSAKILSSLACNALREARLGTTIDSIMPARTAHAELAHPLQETSPYKSLTFKQELQLNSA